MAGWGQCGGRTLLCTQSVGVFKASSIDSCVRSCLAVPIAPSRTLSASQLGMGKWTPGATLIPMAKRELSPAHLLQQPVHNVPCLSLPSLHSPTIAPLLPSQPRPFPLPVVKWPGGWRRESSRR